MEVDAGPILPDLIDSGQRMHHDHLLFGAGHDVRSEDELAKTLRRETRKTDRRLIHSPAHTASTFRQHGAAFSPPGGPTGQSVEVIYACSDR